MTGADPSHGAGGVTIVPASMHYGNVIADLHARNFDEAWSPFTVRQVMNMPGAFGLIAVVGDKPPPGADGPDLAGFALARTAAGECELLSLAVGATWRGQGLGRALLGGVIARATEDGAASVFLEVAEDNTVAQRLYQGRGFRVVGRRPGYYRRASGPAMTALTYSLNLVP